MRSDDRHRPPVAAGLGGIKVWILPALSVAGVLGLLLWFFTGTTGPLAFRAPAKPRTGVAPAVTRRPPAPNPSSTLPTEQEPIAVPTEPATHGTLLGHVRDAEGEPVNGASVMIVPGWASSGSLAVLKIQPGMTVIEDGETLTTRTVRTDERGQFEIGDLVLGREYEIRAGRTGAGRSDWTSVRTSAARPTVETEILLAPTGTLVVTVFDAEGNPRPDAEVELSADTVWPDPPTVENRGAGLFAWGGIVPGAYEVSVRVDGLPLAVRRLEVSAGRDTERILELADSHDFTVLVTDDTGAPIAGAEVVLSPPRQPGSGNPGATRHGEAASGEADAEGRVTFEGIATSSRTVSATAPKHSPTRRDVDTGEGQVTLALDRFGSLRVHLTVPPGTSPPETVHLGFWFRAQQFGDGTFVLEERATRNGFLSIRAEGFVRVNNRYSIEPGQETDLGVIDLQPGLALEGRVLDMDRIPIAGADVYIVSGSGSGSVQSEEDGTFRIETVRPGRYRVAADEDGFITSEVAMEARSGAQPAIILLERAAILVGRVTDVHDAPVGNARIEVVPPAGEAADEDEGHVWRNTDAAGRYHIEVPAGRYTLRVWMPRSDKPLRENKLLLERGAKQTFDVTGVPAPDGG